MANAQRLRWWIDALRSGKYAPALNVYRNADDGYCAEGVGMHVSGICPWQNPPAPGNRERAYVDFYGWLEMEPNAKLNFDGAMHSVPWLNDNYKLSHAQIADLIEAQWLADAESYKAYDAEREALKAHLNFGPLPSTEELAQMDEHASTATYTEDGQVRYE